MYYTKEKIIEYVKSENDKAKLKNIRTLTPIEQTLSELKKETDIVGFFWIDVDGDKAKMEGRTFIRIDHDLYTDDRFAIDMYQAQKEGKTVSDIIKQRNKENKETQLKIENKKELEKTIIKHITKKEEK